MGGGGHHRVAWTRASNSQVMAAGATLTLMQDPWVEHSLPCVLVVHGIGAKNVAQPGQEVPGQATQGKQILRQGHPTGCISSIKLAARACSCSGE
jgi:hypothetical protein